MLSDRNFETLKLIGRDSLLFESDIKRSSENLRSLVSGHRFLVVGGAGSIGQSVVKEIFKREPKAIHIVDISENNLVELVRDLRSSLGYRYIDLKTFAIDCGSIEFEAFVNQEGPYDYIFNLSALKHVRSEKDPFTLMRMLEVNVLNSIKLARISEKMAVKKYFCVSTDKAANPANMMGASKRIMELFLMRQSKNVNISMARFANVAFSDGSLLHGFNQRLIKNQPISSPKDIRRYFLVSQEAGELCLLSGLLAENRENFFPKLDPDQNLISFSAVARKFLFQKGFEPFECQTEEEARANSADLISKGYWPCYFFESDTSGEKKYEEFFLTHEIVDFNKFQNVGIIKNNEDYHEKQLEEFLERIQGLRSEGTWSKSEIFKIFQILIPNFNHVETGKNLDQRM
jgi:FlaA1/EpsC-like NDP-sugar epimerase